MWDVKSPYSGMRGLLTQRLFSFGLVLCAGLFFVLSMAASATLSLFGRFLGEYVRLPESALLVANFISSFAVFVVLFFLIYRFVPDLVLPSRVVAIGAVVTALLFVIGKTVLGFYLESVASSSAYGAAGAPIVIAVWVYYSAQIFLFGAELTWAFGQTKYPEKLREARSHLSWEARRAEPSD
jgi:membrane protein